MQSGWQLGPHPVFGGERCLRARGMEGVEVKLVGRSAEREALGGLLAGAAEGYSGVLVLRGEAGAGKTALLEETLAAAAADGMQAARLTGVEAETQLGYAGLHRFLLPFAGQPGGAAGSAAGRAAQHVRAGGRAAGGPVPGRRWRC